MSMVVTYNDVASSSHSGLYVTGHSRGVFGAVRNEFVELPGRAGHWSFVDEPGSRNVDVQFVLVADSPVERRDALVAALNWLYSATGEKALEFSDQPDRYWSALLAQEINPDEAVRLGRFNASFRCQPYSLAQSITTTCFPASGLSGAINLSDTFAFAGEYPVEPEIVITPTGGTMTSLTFTLNGETLTWAGSIVSGGTLTLSSISSTVLAGASGDVQLTGAFDVADLDMALVAGDFGVVVPGANSWQAAINDGPTAVEVCFYYRRKFR